MAASSLTAGQPSTSLSLLAGNQLDVLCGSAGRALVERFLPDGTVEKTPVDPGKTVRLGEFSDTFVCKITCFSGYVTFEQTRSTAALVDAINAQVVGVDGNLTVIPENTHLTLPADTQQVIYNSLTVSGSHTVNGDLRIL